MHTRLEKWVDEVAAHTKPAGIHWVDGSQAENDTLVAAMLEKAEGAGWKPDPPRWKHLETKTE